jgi:hypothetical protein
MGNLNGFSCKLNELTKEISDGLFSIKMERPVFKSHGICSAVRID